MKKKKRQIFLLVTQVYVPDTPSVGQHMADVAVMMAERGWEVQVLTSRRGYEDPTHKFCRREELDGVSIRRLPLSSLGKKTILHRLIGQFAFCVQATLIGLFTPRLGGILVTTSPPMGGVVGWVISLIRRTPLSFWVMDLNPDQAIAQGVVRENSLSSRVFNAFNRRILHRAQSVIALDRFMAARLKKKVATIDQKLHVMPPWPMEDALERIPPAENPFIAEHGLENKFVLMYSGNHSPVHPLETFLSAAEELCDDPGIVFVFVGGGKAKGAIDQLVNESEVPNILSLPYQPLNRIKYSLSAADVHLVSMGEPMVGCVHPCKFYGAMSLAKPIIYLGPEESHISEVMKRAEIGMRIDHGDVATMVATIRQARSMTATELRRFGDAGKDQIDRAFSKRLLCSALCDTLS